METTNKDYVATLTEVGAAIKAGTSNPVIEGVEFNSNITNQEAIALIEKNKSNPEMVKALIIFFFSKTKFNEDLKVCVKKNDDFSEILRTALQTIMNDDDSSKINSDVWDVADAGNTSKAASDEASNEIVDEETPAAE
jgi:hypothetical protein